MNVTVIASTTLARVAYDDAGGVLQLEFCSGAVYRYFGVPEEVHERLLRACSRGRYFNREIRKRFRHVRVAAGEA